MVHHNFDRIMDFILDEEDGYQVDPEDNGNWTGGKKGLGELKGTKFGISAASYPRLDIKNLSEQDALEIYRDDYWEPICGDSLPEGIDLMVMDCAVNQGVMVAKRALQEACGVKMDGIIGPVTLRAALGGNVLSTLGKVRAMRYVGNIKFNRYGDGWMIRLFRCMELATIWQIEK